MLKLNIITIIFLLLLNSCDKTNKETAFVKKYKIDNYDTVTLISCVSCGGCIEEFLLQKSYSKNNLFVFDEKCNNKFIPKFINSGHVDPSFR